MVSAKAEVQKLWRSLRDEREASTVVATRVSEGVEGDVSGSYAKGGKKRGGVEGMEAGTEEDTETTGMMEMTEAEMVDMSHCKKVVAFGAS